MRTGWTGCVVTVTSVALGAMVGATARLVAQEPAVPEWHVVGHQVISADSIGADGFSWILLSPDGGFTAAAPARGQLWNFAPDGHVIGTIGRSGAGPKEFRGLGSHGLTPNGLWVADPGNRRVTWIDSTGEISKSEPFPRNIDYPASLLRWHLHQPVVEAVGNRHQWIYAAFSAIPPSGKRPDDGSSTRVLFRATSDGTPAEPLAFVKRGTCFQTVKVGGQPGSARRPFCVEPMYRVAPRGDRVAVATWQAGDDGVMFRVVAVGIAGDTLWAWHSTRPWVRFSRSERDSAVAAAAETVPVPEIQQAMRSQLKAAEQAPPFDRLVVGVDGAVWLRCSGTSAVAVWELLNSEGIPMATVRLPRTFRLEAASRSEALGLTTDADGFDNIEIFRF